MSRMLRRLAVHGWPSRLVKVAAVSRIGWDGEVSSSPQGVPIEVAVGASCAQPGLQAPCEGGGPTLTWDGARGLTTTAQQLTRSSFPSRPFRPVTGPADRRIDEGVLPLEAWPPAVPDVVAAEAHGA